MTTTPRAPAQTSIPPQYTPADVEAVLYQRWVDRGYFTADATSDKPKYTIVIPPPNVTGSLHLGHAFQHTLMDALTRRKRMQGFETLWLPGMDHAGISTQTVVERELAKEGLSRHDLGREAFIDRVWSWKAEYGGKILDQMRRLGDGVDWTRERFTFDEGLSNAVQTIFKRLYDDELIYRAERIINWCPRCLTALSDIEVKHSDDEGELVSIRYGDGDGSIVVATTRVETMLGDTAVAVHPDDERYRHLVGTQVPLPLTDRTIPVIADSHVDPAFGSGAVKVTPAHDPNDFEIGRRHNLAMPVILDEHGNVTVPGPFQGLDRFEARPAIVAALREEGRIVAEKRPYLHAVGHCDRCNTVIEPRLWLQWFVKVEPLAKAAGDAVRDGRVAISPVEMSPRYFEWVDNLHDWCISRQLWWGHRIPVWYGPNGEVRCLAAGDPEPTEPGWTQDPDVLDTWFSSALWPFSTLGWPEETDDLKAFFPTDVLLTGYDIIFFWVARMMMFGLYAMDDGKRTPEQIVPFKTIALTGLVRDQFGAKMSKSKGNVVNPLEWMDAYGSDAVRFTLASGANPGSDVPIGEEWVRGNRNFCNKLWNATRFAMGNGATVAHGLPAAAELSSADRWIVARLHETLAAVDTAMDAFEFGKVCDLLYHFVWDDFCDWYVELVKVPLAGGGAAADHVRSVLGYVLDATLRMLHPITPYVTEELWLALTGGESIVVADWPTVDSDWGDAETIAAAEADIAGLQRLITEVRRFRSDQGVRDRQRVPARLTGLSGALASLKPQFRSLTWLQADDESFAPTASVVVGEVRIELDLAGTVDVAAERRRLEKDLAAAQKEQAQAQAKLGNAEFLAKAPIAVREKIEARATAAEADITRLQQQLGDLTPSQV